MSTFLGEISEIPGISVDRFDGSNLKSSLYFLSHCHTDHMHGLGEYFFQKLIECDKYIYCSPISKGFLLGIYPYAPENRIIEIEYAIPKTIRYKTIEDGITVNSWLTVTTSPAGHCPGSVMFVFNKEERTILYTGDFRIDPSDLPKLNALNNNISGKKIAKKFDAIYLDTTFLNLDFRCFPSRKQSCQKISRAIENWLKLDVKNLVILECSANYGPENLFIAIFKDLKTKIHVKEKVHSNYMRIEELAKCVTSDSRSSRIHACTPKLTRNKLLCRSDAESENILTIVPSVQRWKGKNVKTFMEYDSTDKQRLYVCQSMHASYEELKSFVDYFKPDKIVPCVCPEESTSEIYQFIDEFQYYKKGESSGDPDNAPHSFKLISPIVKNLSKRKFKSKYLSDDEDEIENDFNKC